MVSPGRLHEDELTNLWHLEIFVVVHMSDLCEGTIHVFLSVGDTLWVG